MSRESISGCEKRPVSRPAMAVHAPWAWTYLTVTELFSAGCKFCLLQLWSKSEPTKRTEKHRHNVRSELENTLISVRFCMHLKTCSRMLQILGISRRQWKTLYQLTAHSVQQESHGKPRCEVLSSTHISSYINIIHVKYYTYILHIYILHTFTYSILQYMFEFDSEWRRDDVHLPSLAPPQLVATPNASSEQSQSTWGKDG